MTSFKEKYGPWAVITGASSGIGDEFARQLAAKGLNLVLIARRKDRLDALAAELSSAHSIETKTIELDLADPGLLEIIRKETEGLDIGLLLNNAGIAVDGPLHKPDLNRHLQMLNVNCQAPLILAHEFSNRMIERQKGGIIFTSSVSAFFPVPYVGHYAATKVYELFLASTMNYELKRHNIDVQALCPGYTSTEMTDSVKGKVKMMTPEAVVGESLRKLGKKSIVVAGFKNKLMVWFMTKFFSVESLTKIGGKMMGK